MPDLVKRLASFPLAAVLLAYEALDAVFGPVVRPALAWLGSLRIFAAIGRAIAACPPYAVLAMLAVPFAIIEPLKVLALWWMASGHLVTGLFALAAAHLASIFICERIFHAGKAKLLTIGWFARGYGVVARVRDRALAWVKATAAWRSCAGLAAKIHAGFARRLGA
ncbi:hypothetical protein [Methylopila sp. M107]|uniref:hypothetical protein n=1 Tax=Methylopila sp. M107 TaxID=1101190 RepID=UPI00035FF898|nr:hypothetical protein [Methylopila sp. M107]